MIVKNVPINVIEQCAESIGATLYNDLDKSTKRTPYAYQFRLVPTDASKDQDHYIRISDAPYTNHGYRRVNAVCWHGHAVFMAKIYASYPNAVIRTAFTTYTCAADFFARFMTDGIPAHDKLSIVTHRDTYKHACLCDSQDQYSVDVAIKDARADVANIMLESATS